MIVSYSDSPVIKGEKSMFLAGPTVRKEQQDLLNLESWRKQAIEILEQIGYDGIVYVPEYATMKDFIDKDEQFEWEWEALHASSVVVFWVPRKFPDLPAMTTNVEFGFYINHKPLVYGRPESSDKNGYLDRFYYKFTNQKPFNNLQDLLECAVIMLKKD